VLIPLSAERYLDSFELPDFTNTFVLGSFARHVTIYSQQVRALNLIHSLVKTKRFSSGSSVVVVGGGAAGVTAAASLLLSVPGSKVTLLEKFENVMPLQRASAKRYVHPHIYDWPEEGSTDEEAGLHVFNWRAAEARTVAEGFREEWNNLRNKYPSRLVFRKTAKLTSVARKDTGYEISWDDHEGSHNVCAEIFILAMGFGRDTDPIHNEDYWQDNWIDQPRGVSSRWLVSGTGDGGLTDLMRLKVNGFQHHLIIRSFSEGPKRSLKSVREVLESVKPESSVEALSGEFGSALQQVLEAQGIRHDTKVILNDEKNLSKARASLLNRLIVHELHQTNAFSFRQGRLGGPIAKGNKYRLEGLADEFDRVLIRRGPTADVPVDQIEKLAVDDSFKSGYKKLRQRWQDWTGTHIPQDDHTRIPCWTEGELNPEHGFKLPATKLSQPRPPGACLAIIGDRTPWSWTSESEFERTIRQSVEQTGGSISFEGVKLSGNPHVISASEAFSGDESHKKVVALLCEAPVAVFDVTDLEPAVMLLLGIRAAARRGVTVTLTRTVVAPEFWASLPFNLREVNTISTIHPPGSKSTDRQNPIHRLSNAFKDAATELQRHPHYADLPGYFELRMPSSEGAVDENYVLLLCPFEPVYLTKTYQEFLNGELDSIFKPKPVLLISELASPKLVALRLYDAIRRSFFCVADWTYWRPNVMFELGVRSAVSDQNTVSLINRMEPIPEKYVDIKGQLLRLRQFFSPIEYNPTGGPGQFDTLKELYEIYNGRAVERDYPALFSLLNPHLTFQKTAKSIRSELDPGLTSVESFLNASAHGLAQHADDQPEVLFGGDPRIGQLARLAATERLLANWYFVKHRRLALDPTNQATRQSLITIGNDLLPRLSGDDPVRIEIEVDLGLRDGGKS
jgi:hypothetical protein